MGQKFKNKYRIPSARLANWDYGSNAPYFITICTAHRQHFFGNIVSTPIVETPKLGVSTMQLSEIGQIAQKYWMEIPDHFPFVTLDAFVVMPNHIHGIIVFEKNIVQTPNLGVSTDLGAVSSPKLDETIQTPPQTAAASQKWKPQTLGVIINQYKRAVTINARKIDPNYAWQSRFHDHVIRDNKSFNNIRNYIINNTINWEKDKFNPISKQ